MTAVHPPLDSKMRLLKPLRQKYIPPLWLFVDTETREVTENGDRYHRFMMGWTCLWTHTGTPADDSHLWQFFTSEVDLNAYIHTIALQLGDIILVGHNIFFDLQGCGFYSYFARYGWSLEFYYDKGLTYIMKLSLRGAKITVLSTTNWFDQSLESLGRVLGLHKGEVDFTSATAQQLKEYCRRDVEIIVEAVKYYLDFLTAHSLGKFSLTKASQAFTAFRHRFMDTRIFIHDHVAATDLERKAYSGGRTECFQIGEITGGPFVTLDVNSMYPYVMDRYTYPVRLIGYHKEPPVDKIRDVLKTGGVIAHVLVSTPEAAYLVRRGRKVIFPTGTFDCYLSTRGVAYALERGHIVQIYSAAVYRMENIFSQYVRYFYDLKQKYLSQGNHIMSLLTKYMLNSLYGKFAQLEIITDMEDEDTGRAYWREDVPNVVTGRMVTITHLMNRRLIQYPGGEGENSVCSIAAHITEDARLTLWHIIRSIGPGRVLYCDTDSVKIREKDLGRVRWPMDESALGALKVEDRSRRLYIGGAKNYRTEDERKIKGIPHKAVEVEPGVFRFISFARQISQLREGKHTGVRVREITRSLRHSYDKGEVDPSGLVTPFHL